MEELDQNLKPLSINLALVSIVLCILALLMVRFDFTNPKNMVWECMLFALKACGHSWFFIIGRYSAKEIFKERASKYELKLAHAQEQLNEQRLKVDEARAKTLRNFEALKLELAESRRREDVLLQKLRAIQQTPSDVNQNALKSFL